MGLFSVLYLILLPVVWLPSAMLVVNKSAGDFVILATLSMRTKRKLSWSCLCCCSYQTVQKWGLYFWSMCGGRGKRTEQEPCWVPGASGHLAPSSSWPPWGSCSWYLQVCALSVGCFQSCFSLHSYSISHALVISHAVIPCVESTSAPESCVRLNSTFLLCLLLSCSEQGEQGGSLQVKGDAWSLCWFCNCGIERDGRKSSLSPVLCVGILLHSQSFGKGAKDKDSQQRSNLVSQQYQEQLALRDDGGQHIFLIVLAAAAEYQGGFYCRVLVGLPDSLIESDWSQFDSSRWESKTVKPDFKAYHLAWLAQDVSSVPAPACMKDGGRAAGFPRWPTSSKTTSLGAGTNNKHKDLEKVPFLRDLRKEKIVSLFETALEAQDFLFTPCRALTALPSPSSLLNLFSSPLTAFSIPWSRHSSTANEINCLPPAYLSAGPSFFPSLCCKFVGPNQSWPQPSASGCISAVLGLVAGRASGLGLGRAITPSSRASTVPPLWGKG